MKSQGAVFNAVIVGATAPGIVAAARMAREGLRVALVASGPRIGGSLPSLGAIETHYRGIRAPILEELCAGVRDHYLARYGEGSAQYRACTGGKMLTFEPHVAEGVLESMVAAEGRIKVVRGFIPHSIEREGRQVRTAHFRNVETGAEMTLRGSVFLEAGYEGDFMAVAGARWRIGREARSEFGEPRAGRVFTEWITGEFPRAAVEGRLNLVPAGATTSDPLPGSTREGDDNIQSYSYRLCLTDDPANRRVLEAPPDGYDRGSFAPILLPPAEKEKLRLPFHHRFLIHSLREMVERDHIFHGHALPNRKRSWNATNLTGAGKSWADANFPGRAAIARQHRDHALGLMWFLQNDPAMPADLREKARQWGLARDEFADNDNIPHQLYVREARRLHGRSVFTENDALLAPGTERAPVHADSIAITEFSLDSLACTTERLPGSLCDGQLFQMEVSRPGQVPYGCLLPRELDNLLVVTTVSATHVGWGTIRQTPTLMHIAESAAWAAVLAVRRIISPAAVDVTELQQILVENRVMISFFNDLDMSTAEPWALAIQVLGTQGFIEDYNARPQDSVDEKAAEQLAGLAGVTPAVFAGLKRGEACRRCFELMPRC